MRTNRGSVPRLMLRVPSVETVMMIGKRNEDPRAGLLVARDELVGFPVQQRPLCAKVFVSEPGGWPIMFEVIFVLPRPLNVHVARVPITGFGHTLRAPMGPDAELSVAVPFGTFVFKQRFPGG